MISHEEVIAEIETMKKREVELLKRTELIEGINENLVIIQRIDFKQSMSFLTIDQRARMDRLRESWYGKVLLVSPTDSQDAVMEFKKKKIAVGDVISYNPESAYSLNIADHSEIWVIHIDNVLIIDRGYDPIKAKEAALKRMYAFTEEDFQDKMRKAQTITNAMKLANKGGNVVSS